MKKTVTMAFVAALMGVFLLQGKVSADSLDGIVLKVNEKSNTVTVQQLAAQDERFEADSQNKNIPEKIEFKVQREADLKNITDLNDLKTGNRVKVDYKENPNLGIWEATKIELTDSRDYREEIKRQQKEEEMRLNRERSDYKSDY